MTMNDLTAPLGQQAKRHQRAIHIPVAQVVALALGLFLGAFVLWAVIAEDRSGGEPVAVAPADLHIAKKPPGIVAVPQAAAASESAEPATTATVPQSAPKSPGGVTVTIIDGKTGAKREVVVAAPPEPSQTLPDKR